MRFNISWNGAGFRITLGNGYGISVVFAPFSYCDNYDMMPIEECIEAENKPGVFLHAGIAGCANAEVAILKPNGGFLHREEWGDSVKGHVTPDELVELLQEVSKWSSDDIPKLEGSER